MSRALEQMKAAGIGVICQSSSSKLPTSCLHGYSASLHKLHGSTFFWEAIFVTPTIVLARTIHTLAWKIRVEKCHLSFWYGILPGSFPFQTWCGDFHFWESIKNSVEQAKQLSLRSSNLSSEIHECRPLSSYYTVCLSIIKTSKRSGTSETCTTCMSLPGLTFHDPGPR